MDVARAFVDFCTAPIDDIGGMGGAPWRARLCFDILLTGLRVDLLWWTNGWRVCPLGGSLLVIVHAVAPESGTVSCRR